MQSAWGHSLQKPLGWLPRCSAPNSPSSEMWISTIHASLHLPIPPSDPSVYVPQIWVRRDFFFPDDEQECSDSGNGPLLTEVADLGWCIELHSVSREKCFFLPILLLAPMAVGLCLSPWSESWSALDLCLRGFMRMRTTVLVHANNLA